MAWCEICGQIAVAQCRAGCANSYCDRHVVLGPRPPAPLWGEPPIDRSVFRRDEYYAWYKAWWSFDVAACVACRGRAASLAVQEVPPPEPCPSIPSHLEPLERLIYVWLERSYLEAWIACSPIGSNLGQLKAMGDETLLAVGGFANAVAACVRVLAKNEDPEVLRVFRSKMQLAGYVLPRVEMFVTESGELHGIVWVDPVVGSTRSPQVYASPVSLLPSHSVLHSELDPLRYILLRAAQYLRVGSGLGQGAKQSADAYLETGRRRKGR